ncbi:MAG TPA: phosphodiesterase [Planctomycetaceae bacterium]|nr:phosphodiesterase [Planctomycetaceae bacterium]
MASAIFLAGLLVAASDRTSADEPIKKIAFGSCATQQRPCPIWSTIADYKPDWLLLLGDNIYADVVEGRLKPATPERIQEAYDELARVEGFIRLRQEVPIFATWDDHDYGNNDAGVEWEHKDAAAKMFHDFFGTPSESPLRQQRGIYNAKIIGPPGKRVQMIMLDTRYFRSELEKGAEPMPGFRAKPYVAAAGKGVTMLGDTQWKWLAEQLKHPAELRIIGTSIQVLSDDHPFEKWGNMPAERERLFDLIRAQEASGVVFISGDRHLGEISVDDQVVGYPLYDVTASGLNQANLGWRMPEPNVRRHSSLPYGNHFGTIEIDWDANDPVVSLQLRHEDGEIAVQSRVPLSQLKAGRAPKPRPEGIMSPLQALALNEGDELTVQFNVVAGRVIGNGERILLNSDADFRSPKNFTVVVNRSAMTGDYASANSDRFKDKTIRATGTISLYNGAKQLQVDDAAKLSLIE